MTWYVILVTELYRIKSIAHSNGGYVTLQPEEGHRVSPVEIKQLRVWSVHKPAVAFELV